VVAARHGGPYLELSEQTPLFLVSLKAGGSGLDLTAADFVVLLDPWWNPAAEAQAIDRAHRIGRERPVNVRDTHDRADLAWLAAELRRAPTRRPHTPAALLAGACEVNGR
jgi:hypothetical protein